jgi:hypothetical protein
MIMGTTDVKIKKYYKIITKNRLIIEKYQIQIFPLSDEASRHKDRWGSGGTAPRILNPCAGR